MDPTNPEATLVDEDADMLRDYYALAGDEELSVVPRSSHWLLRIELNRCARLRACMCAYAAWCLYVCVRRAWGGSVLGAPPHARALCTHRLFAWLVPKAPRRLVA